MPQTPDALLREVAAILDGGTVDVGPREAEWLIEAAGSDDEARAFARRRAAGEPFQYIVGRAAFRHIELAVGPGVLVPRPETEVLVDRVLARLPDGGTVLDVGTGSGAIALAIKHERGDARVIASDVDDKAIEWCELNARSLGLEIDVHRSDLFDGLPRSLQGAFDVIVSNPPYVASDAANSLPVDVVEHEPHVALFAGEDGLATIRVLVSEAPGWLRHGGWLVMEIGETQGASVRQLLTDGGFADVAVHPDITGRDRIAEGRVAVSDTA